MAYIDDLHAALIKADATGNAGDAKAFADEIRKLQSSQQVAPDPTEGMSTFEKAAAGAGAQLSNRYLGIKQRLGLATEADVEEKRKLDAPLFTPGAQKPPVDYTGPANIEGGRFGVHRGLRTQGTKPTAAEFGAFLGDAIPLAAISTLVPGANTVLGSTALGGLTGMTEPTGPGESVTKNSLIGMAAGGTPALGLKLAGAGTKALRLRGESEGADQALMNSVRDQTIKDGVDLGYRLPRSATGGGFLSNRLESIGGKAAIGQETVIRNQEVTNAIGRREAGLADNAPLSEGTLAKARDGMSGPYKEVAGLSPRAAQALEDLKQARADAKAQYRFYERSLDPDVLKKAQSLDNRAELLERVIDKEATRVGRPDLLPALKDARQRLAKNYDVERALNVGSGDLDARVWGRMLDHGKPLTGDLEKAARFSESFKKYTREAGDVQAPGVSKLEPVASAAFGLAGHASGLGWWGAGLPLLSGPARSIALSKLMQGPSSYGPGTGLKLADLAANNPQLRRIAPASAISLAPYSEQ